MLKKMDAVELETVMGGTIRVYRGADIICNAPVDPVEVGIIGMAYKLHLAQELHLHRE